MSIGTAGSICGLVQTMNTKTPKLILRLLAGLALAATVALHSGCVVVAAGAAGAGAVAYIRGELDASLGNNYEAVVKAANRTISQLEFAKIGTRKDALSANLTARTAQDKKVEIIVTKSGDALTRVQIRIGVFGDEQMSMTILDKIKANL